MTVAPRPIDRESEPAAGSVEPPERIEPNVYTPDARGGAADVAVPASDGHLPPSKAKPLEDRMGASIARWQERLLDLSMLNPALNFRVRQVATVTIVDEIPGEVFAQLCLREAPMRFHPLLPSPGRATPVATDAIPAATATTPTAPTPDASAADVVLDDGDDQPSLAADFAPYDPESLDARHTDDVLQCQATPERLDQALRRLDQLARSALEERGVNVLYLALGMLHYTESRDSEQPRRAPIVLVPVTLERANARVGFTVRATDEGALLNPSLGAYLKRQHGIELPELPDYTDRDDFALQDYMLAVTRALAPRTDWGWSVKLEIFLSTFSFQKLAMYKDLEANAPAFARHRVVRALVGRSGDAVLPDLPPEIKALELDEAFPPELGVHVVDADGSQLRALAAVAAGHDLVIEGPPGTGKSQTITNLIAQALAAGQSVLFMSEKMAALNVVRDRLKRAGLDEFCLELHSPSANKREVMQSIRSAIDSTLSRPEGVSRSDGRLADQRARLTAYTNAVHAPFGVLALSPYQGFGHFGEAYGAPRWLYAGDAMGVTREQLEEWCRRLDELATAGRGVGDPTTHPFRGATKTIYGESELDEISRLVDADAKLTDAFAAAATAVEVTGVTGVERAADVRRAQDAAAILGQSPGAPAAVLTEAQTSARWDSVPDDAAALVGLGRSVVGLATHLQDRFTNDVMLVDHAADIAYVEERSQGFFGFLAVFDGRFRAIKRRWLSYRRPNYRGSLLDQAGDLRLVAKLVDERRRLSDASAAGRVIFGDHWRGESSNWDELRGYLEWMVEFRRASLQYALTDAAATFAVPTRPDVTAAARLATAAETLTDGRRCLEAVVGWPDGYLTDTSAETFDAHRSRVAELAGRVQLGPAWAAFEAARVKAADTPAGEIVGGAIDGRLTIEQVRPAFRRSFFQQWLDQVMRARPELKEFHTLGHEERIAEFRHLDRRILYENQVALVERLREMGQQRLQDAQAQAGMPMLRRELARQRGFSPLRKTLKATHATVRAVKPCFLMSPLTVAQYLDGQEPSFDLVVFDEASQLPTEDAVGAIVRGKSLVVVGDPKQLPPTNFFAVAAGTVAAPIGDDGQPLFEDTESVLEEALASGVHQGRLKWHYRSAHESLIHFSNANFYDAELKTFPSASTDTESLGLSFTHVADGVYEGKGANSIEARRVVDGVVEHMLTRPDESLGVGTFNMRQQLAIQDEFELRRRQDPRLEEFLARHAEKERFFVKNLENIQGDERDVIFLSVTYGKAPDGRLRYNWGPINGENGWRRLNVLVTRARKRMRVFSTMRADDINPTATTARGAQLLREFLKYAETGRLDSVYAQAAAATESPLERDVLTELANRGYLVDAQVGVAGYRIDLGVRTPELQGRYVCGVECDGVAYHSSETARDRDRLRQQVLEDRGWNIIRVWSTDWFKDRAGQIERLVAYVENARRNAIETRDTEAALRRKEEEDRLAREAEELARAREAPTADPLLTHAYDRPTLVAYRFADGQGRYAGSDILEVPLNRIAQAVVAVVTVEAPIHVEDVATRVAGMWGNRLGSRIAARIDQAIRAAVSERLVSIRGKFLWTAAGPAASRCVPRSRAGTRITADRIAPEEIGEAIRIVLGAAGHLTLEELTTEIRGAMGLGRGYAVPPAVEAVVNQMIASKILGEGSLGLALRDQS